jgi:hypothetical protein
MPSICINVIDHRPDDHQPVGEIICPWFWQPGQIPGTQYADFCALYHIWKAWDDWEYDPPYDIIGFFGYRKYLVPRDPKNEVWMTPAHAPNWFACREEVFDEYREGWARGHETHRLLPLLAQYDILQAPPFPVYDMIDDFRASRSEKDAELLGDALGWKLETNIYPYLFITRWSVFDRAMWEMEPARIQLHGRCTGEDSEDPEYKKRPMAYVMERVWSHWLTHSGLSIKEVPLLHCWEKK